MSISNESDDQHFTSKSFLLDFSVWNSMAVIPVLLKSELTLKSAVLSNLWSLRTLYVYITKEKYIMTKDFQT